MQELNQEVDSNNLTWSRCSGKSLISSWFSTKHNIDSILNLTSFHKHRITFYLHIQRCKGIIVPIGAFLSLLLLVKLHSDILKATDVSKEPPTYSPVREVAGVKPYLARRLPQAIIIGARKSGTRALLKFLELNPAIKAAPREVHFFDKPQNYKRGLDWYESQMPLSNPNQVTIEKSPAYFITPGVPQRIKAMNSSIKLVLIMRNPVIRLISDYSQLAANKINAQEMDNEDLYEGVESEDDLEEPGKESHLNITGLAEMEKAQFDEYALRLDGGVDQQRPAVRTGMYSIYLERWRSYFPMRQIHLVDGENLITNPQAELRQIELFLGLEPFIQPEHFIFNPQKGFYCMARPVTNSSSGYNRAGRNRRMLDVSKDSICLSKSKGRKHVAVRKETIETLEQFYEPYNEYLFSITNRSFDWEMSSHRSI